MLFLTRTSSSEQQFHYWTTWNHTFLLRFILETFTCFYISRSLANRWFVSPLWCTETATRNQSYLITVSNGWNGKEKVAVSTDSIVSTEAIRTSIRCFVLRLPYVTIKTTLEIQKTTNKEHWINVPYCCSEYDGDQ